MKMLTPVQQQALDGLQAFIGGRARFWRYTVSHSHLAVRLRPKGEEKDIYLVLSGCKEIAAPVSWAIVRPQIVVGETPWIELLDEDVRIVCRDASLHDTYPDAR